MRQTISGLIGNINGSGSSAHAYILEGGSAASRQIFAEKLAEGLGCGILDTVHMQKSGKEGYKTEDANVFAARLGMGAYGSCLLGIIDEADILSETVQNKLLKTLEEPAGNVVILLCASNRDHLLDTVKSRCSVLRAGDFEDANLPADDEDQDRSGAIREAAALMLNKETAFYEFRDAVAKNVKGRADALPLIDAAEDLMRERMIAGETPAAFAAGIELAEKARADIERGMDRSKALKRLFLQLSAVRKKIN